MSSLSSLSTDAEVWSAYDDNASYDEDSSVTKASAFVTACRILLRRRPSRMTTDGQSIEFDAELIREELEDARRWADANKAASGASVRHLNFSRLRD